jgi:hypothetical protein
LPREGCCDGWRKEADELDCWGHNRGDLAGFDLPHHSVSVAFLRVS